MDEPHAYEIRVEGCLSERWTSWFAGLAIHCEGQAETTLSGVLIDQAALFGVLGRIHALNLSLLSVQRITGPAEAEAPL